MAADAAGLSRAQRARLADELRARHNNVVGQLQSIESALGEVRASRGTGDSDDEHDPEGPTLSSEWSRLAGAETGLDVELAAIDRALALMDARDYGVCQSCGGPIGFDRLLARPEAELCIACARLQSPRR